MNDKTLSEEKTLLGGETLVGQRFWFVPNSAATLRIGFARSTMHEDLVNKKWVPPFLNVINGYNKLKPQAWANLFYYDSNP